MGPMTLKFEYGRCFCTAHLPTGFHHPMFNRSEVIALTYKQTRKQTNKQTDSVENIRLSSLYALRRWRKKTIVSIHTVRGRLSHVTGHLKWSLIILSIL